MKAGFCNVSELRNCFYLVLTTFFFRCRHMLTVLRAGSLTSCILGIAALRTFVARVPFLVFGELALVVALLHALALVLMIHIIWHKNENLLEDLYLEQLQ